MERSTHRTAWFVVGGVLVLTLAACADDAADDVVEDAPVVEGEQDQATAPGDALVEATDFAFEPGQLTIVARATVTWSNLDEAAHTVTSGRPGDADGDFDEPLEPAGGSASFTFDEPGTFAYHCALHPTMTGEIVVEPAPA